MGEKKDIREKAKSLWIKGMKAIGNTAANIANNTRYKVDEVTIQNRRREVLNDLAHTAYALWLKGETLPAQMDKMLNELKRLDEQLNDIRAEKYALSNKPEQNNRPPQENDQNDAQTEEENETAEEPEIQFPVSTEINELFDNSSSVGRSAEKVNSTLDQMSDRIRLFQQKTKDDKE